MQKPHLMMFLRKAIILLTLASISHFPAIAIAPPSSLQPAQHKLLIQNGVPLRILPLGNSITWGYGSTSGNGYRFPLLNFLSPSNPVTYIGSQHSGNMSNNANEGHPGALIAQIATYANLSLDLRPNVILVMAGTNDINANINATSAPDRLASLTDQCITSCPDAAILVAQLTPIANDDSQTRADDFNAAIPGIVDERAKRGKKVLVVDMEKYVTIEELMDGLHPDDVGYEGMAMAWYDGIKYATSKGWIGEPVSNGGNASTVVKSDGAVE